MGVRIFVDAHVFDNEFQGTRTFILELYTILAYNKDLEIFLAANDLNNLKKEFKAIADFKNIQFLHLKSQNKFKRLIFEIPELIKKHKIDYAHFQYIIPPFVVCKYIVTIHDVLFIDFPKEFSALYRFSKTFLFKYAAKRSQLVTTVSEYSKQSIIKHFKINEKKIILTPNGVSERFFIPLDKENSKNIIQLKYHTKSFILYVSRFEPRKNHYILLKVYLDLKLYEKGFQLVLLGHQSAQTTAFKILLEQQTQEIKNQILIRDKVNNEDLIHFYNAAELFVYPSKAEGFGIPPLEAGALKTTVICSNSTAMQDFTFFGKHLIDIDEYSKLKQLIQEVINSQNYNPDLNTISNSIKEKYNWKHSAEALLSALNKN